MDFCLPDFLRLAVLFVKGVSCGSHGLESWRPKTFRATTNNPQIQENHPHIIILMEPPGNPHVKLF